MAIFLNWKGFGGSWLSCARKVLLHTCIRSSNSGACYLVSGSHRLAICGVRNEVFSALWVTGSAWCWKKDNSIRARMTITHSCSNFRPNISSLNKVPSPALCVKKLPIKIVCLNYHHKTPINYDWSWLSYTTGTLVIITNLKNCHLMDLHLREKHLSDIN